MNQSIIRRSHRPFELLDRFFQDDVFGPALRSFSPQGNGASESWIPSVDLGQTEDSFTVSVDLPGLDKDDVELSVENRTLTISGERAFTKNGDSESFERIERAFGKFTRSFTLPSNADVSGVSARFEKGVLLVEVPKLEEAKSRQIDIS